MATVGMIISDFPDNVDVILILNQCIAGAAEAWHGEILAHVDDDGEMLIDIIMTLETGGMQILERYGLLIATSPRGGAKWRLATAGDGILGPAIHNYAHDTLNGYGEPVRVSSDHPYVSDTDFHVFEGEWPDLRFATVE